MKKDKIFQLKIVIFTPVKNRCMLHGRIFVMLSLRLAKRSLILLCVSSEVLITMSLSFPGNFSVSYISLVDIQQQQSQ